MMSSLVEKNCILIMIVLASILWGCNDSLNESQSGYSDIIAGYTKEVGDSIIANNDYTIIFLWTDWCSAGHSVFNENIVPFLEKKSHNVGFISVFYGDKKKVVQLMEKSLCIYPIFQKSGYGGVIDKIRINRFIKSYYPGHKFANYVPITLLLSRDKEILNYCDQENTYNGIQWCLHYLENLENLHE